MSQTFIYYNKWNWEAIRALNLPHIEEQIKSWTFILNVSRFFFLFCYTGNSNLSISTDNNIPYQLGYSLGTLRKIIRKPDQNGQVSLVLGNQVSLFGLDPWSNQFCLFDYWRHITLLFLVASQPTSLRMTFERFLKSAHLNWKKS